MQPHWSIERKAGNCISNNLQQSSLRGNAESTGEKQKSTENDVVIRRIKRLHISSREDEASSVGDSATSTVPGNDENANVLPFVDGEGDLRSKLIILTPKLK
ncbi:Bgt-51453 [Blumeria graminis f. sp. tritici]|uniref:Bgt-51453 n=1 Tax=Blumeria graminis f. sp. tritici TaxID=62690 RepID=A0A9X9MEH1_BLUGR|nr:Bgt-51453 [Blumeria graminis f. sp. tritici]